MSNPDLDAIYSWLKTTLQNRYFRNLEAISFGLVCHMTPNGVVYLTEFTDADREIFWGTYCRWWDSLWLDMEGVGLHIGRKDEAHCRCRVPWGRNPWSTLYSVLALAGRRALCRALQQDFPGSRVPRAQWAPNQPNEPTEEDKEEAEIERVLYDRDLYRDDEDEELQQFDEKHRFWLEDFARRVAEDQAKSGKHFDAEIWEDGFQDELERL